MAGLAFGHVRAYVSDRQGDADMRVNELELDELKAALEAGSVLLVDVREPHEFAAGHIPGSVSMPLSGFDPGAIPDGGDRQVVFSCAAGVRSLRAMEFAQASGVDIDTHYPGGFKEWLMAGEPVAT